MNRNIVTQAEADADNERAMLAGMRALQRECFDTSAQHGFHDMDAQNLDPAEVHDSHASQDQVTVPREYLAMLQDTRRLMLMVSEVSEAMEHQRDGNPPVFYLCKKCGARFTLDDDEFPVDIQHCGTDLKPDGLGFELADVVIRAWDQAERSELDLPALVVEKMAYNQGRPHRHGRAF